MGLDALLDTLVVATVAAVNAAGLTAQVGTSAPGQVGKGKPSAIELAKILKPAASSGWLGSIYPHGSAGNATRYRPEPVRLPPAASPLHAAVAGNVVTFSGASQAALNVHVFADPPAPCATYVTVPGDSPATIATQLAAKVTALGRPGLTADATGPALTVHGASIVQATIGVGGLKQTIMDVSREAQDVQLTFWARNPKTRITLRDVARAAIGTSRHQYYALPDGSYARVRFGTSPAPMDDSQQSEYALYIAHIVFECDYAITETVDAAQIGAVVVASADSGGDARTDYVSGQ